MAVSTWSTGRAAPTTDRSDDLTIDPTGLFRAGRGMTTFVPGDDGSFLVAYLKLVRRLRHQKSDPQIELRRTEIELLADHLGADPADILERLGALMGASITQRRVLAASFAAGAAVLFLAVGASAAMSGGGAPSPTDPFTITTRDAESNVAVAGELTELHDALPLIVIESTSPDRSADVLSPPDLAVVAAASPSDSTTSPATAPRTVPPTAAADAAAVDTNTTTTPDEVAVDEPPVPTPPDEVAVGEPPVPTPPFEVAVAEPPVPTPPAG